MTVNPADVGAVVVHIGLTDTTAVTGRRIRSTVLGADGIQIYPRSKTTGAEPDGIPVRAAGAGVVGAGKVGGIGRIPDRSFGNTLIQTDRIRFIVSAVIWKNGQN